MSIAAFTNAPGTHSRRKTITGYQSGKYYGAENIHELLYNETVEEEQCFKWYPTPGFGRCTDWSRGVRKLVADEPAIARRFVVSGYGSERTVIVNLEVEDHISRSFPLGSYIATDPGYDNGKNESVTKALNDLTQHYAGIGADLGQARKTCDELSRLALKAGGFLSHLKHGQLKQAAESLLGLRGWKLRDAQKTAADLWLQWIYGWKPLANDLFEAQKLAHDALEGTVLIKGTGHGKSEHSTTLPNFYGFKIDSTSASTHRTCLIGQVTNPELYRLNSAGLINPLSIAWELVPWSFAIDWFIPIGGTLQAITAGVGLESKGGFTSSQTHDATIRQRVLPEIDETASYYAWVRSGDCREIGFSFHRQCYTEFPAPKLYADVTPYSTVRAVNALALVRSLV